MTETLILDLHLFDGDGGGAGAAGGGAAGAAGSAGAEGDGDSASGIMVGNESAALRKAMSAPGARTPQLKAPQQPQQAETPAPPAETKSADRASREAEYDRLIKEYNDIHTDRTRKIISERFPKAKEAEQKIQQLSPVLDMVAKKYGIEPGDFDGLQKALESDDALYEDEAIKRGLTVDQARDAVKTEQRLKELEAVESERRKQAEINRITTEWMDEGRQLQQVYPNFDIQSELQNGEFLRKLSTGYTVRDAYESLHRDEILGSAMQTTASKVSEKLTANIRARGSRPVENGTSAPTPAIVRKDPSSLTREERAELVKRAGRGERIDFGR
jgi:hypothetical protein